MTGRTRSSPPTTRNKEDDDDEEGIHPHTRRSTTRMEIPLIPIPHITLECFLTQRKTIPKQKPPQEDDDEIVVDSESESSGMEKSHN